MRYKDYIDKSIEQTFASLFNKCLDKSVYTSSTYTEENLTKENMDDMIEKLRPEYAVLLNNYAPIGEIFEMENNILEKYYCKQLLIINSNYYHTKLKSILESNGINIKVYE